MPSTFGFRLQQYHKPNPLWEAADKGDIIAVRKLLHAGKYVDEKMHDWTPLHRASINGHEEIVQILLAAGANIDAKDGISYTPLVRASQFGKAGVVKILLESGSSVSGALLEATIQGHAEVVKVLLDAGVSIECRGDKITPLLVAAEKGHTEIVKLLLDAGANIEAKDSYQRTPLGVTAFFSGNKEVAKMLLDAGADVSTLDWEGRTALQLANLRGNTAVERILREYEARIANACDNIKVSETSTRLSNIHSAQIHQEIKVIEKTDRNLQIDMGSGIIMNLVWIPPGTFLMGSPEYEPENLIGAKIILPILKSNWALEKPQHYVTISSGFWMGKYPVTQKEFLQLMGYNPAGFTAVGLNAPVVNVNWFEADDFCQKMTTCLLMEFPNTVVQMPTEAEWEYGCRSGVNDAYAGDWQNMGWFEENSGGKIHVVGQKQPNNWGLYDMHGNVLEWCYDGLRNYTTEPQIDPIGSIERGRARWLRGGAYNYSALDGRSASRIRDRPTHEGNHIGFRVVIREKITGYRESTYVPPNCMKKPQPEDYGLTMSDISTIRNRLNADKLNKDDLVKLITAIVFAPFLLPTVIALSELNWDRILPLSKNNLRKYLEYQNSLNKWQERSDHNR